MQFTIFANRFFIQGGLRLSIVVQNATPLVTVSENKSHVLYYFIPVKNSEVVASSLLV